jgi:hypothetical protein
MNTGTDPSNALASLLAILSQSTQPPSSHITSHPRPNSQPPPPANQHVDLQNIEPVFIEEDIFETTQWIGVPTVPWSEPRKWQLPRPDLTVLAERRIPTPRLTTPTIPEKRKRSPSPAPQKTQSVSPGSPQKTFTNYSLALKHVLRQSEDAEFMDAMRRVKKRQDDIETDLWEDRERIKRSFDSKRKMNQVLKSLGSQYKDEQVPSPRPVWLTKDVIGGGEG